MKKIIAIFALSISAFLGASVSQAEDFDLRHTYVVEWEITTDDKELYKNTLPDHINKILELWKQGIIENVYFNHEAAKTYDYKSAKAVFFIKAENVDQARKQLNTFPLIQKKVASYKLSPVGILWIK